MRRLPLHVSLALGLLTVTAACAGDPGSPGASTRPPGTEATTSSSPPPDTGEALPAAAETARQIATTSGDRTGNRIVAGSANLSATPVSMSLNAVADWVVGAATPDGVVWLVVDEAGSVETFLESDGTVEAHRLKVNDLASGMPPTMVVDADGVTVFDPRNERSDVSPLAGHTVVDGTPIVVAADGGVFMGDTRVDDVAALHDTRIVVSEGGLVALLTHPTDRFTHAVLGDAIEAESVTLLDPPTAGVVATLDAPDDTVFEAISPLWADVDGDGSDEILVTASDADNGARLVVFRADGTILAQSSPIGRGNRWLNQLGVAPLGPNGEIEVVEVRTPHIGGIVGWYRLDGEKLVRQTTVSEYSTHGIFSRNLDEGLIVDADGDGRLDVVVPTQDNRQLVALTRTGDGAEPTLVIELPAPPSSNLAGVTRNDGTASLALATEDGRLLIWP